LGEILQQVSRVEKVDPERQYRLLGVRWYANGCHLHNTVSGRELKTKVLSTVRAGDVTYNKMWTSKGAFGVVKEEQEGFAATSEYPLFTARAGSLSPAFIECIFRQPKFWAAARALCKGTTQRARLNPGDFLRLPIDLPVPCQQERIVNILGAVDDAIKANDEVVARTRDFNRLLANELLARGLPGRHTRFKESALGQVPVGWEVKPLGSLLREQIRNGYSANAVEQVTGRWILSLSAVSERGFNPKGVKPLALDENGADAFTLSPSDLLVSRSNTKEKVGLCGIYDGNPINCAYPDLLMRIRVKREEIDNKFLEQWFLSAFGRRYFSTQARGTSGSMVKINRAILERFPVPVPSPQEQKEIATVIGRAARAEENARSFVDRLQKTGSIFTQLLVSGHTFRI
jgi:type I restriction enzyme S subunit